MAVWAVQGTGHTLPGGSTRPGGNALCGMEQQGRAACWKCSGRCSAMSCHPGVANGVGLSAPLMSRAATGCCFLCCAHCACGGCCTMRVPHTVGAVLRLCMQPRWTDALQPRAGALCDHGPPHSSPHGCSRGWRCSRDEGSACSSLHLLPPAVGHQAECHSCTTDVTAASLTPWLGQEVKNHSQCQERRERE